MPLGLRITSLGNNVKGLNPETFDEREVGTKCPSVPACDSHCLRPAGDLGQAAQFLLASETPSSECDFEEFHEVAHTDHLAHCLALVNAQ